MAVATGKQPASRRCWVKLFCGDEGEQIYLLSLIYVGLAINLVFSPIESESLKCHQSIIDHIIPLEWKCFMTNVPANLCVSVTEEFGKIPVYFI